MHFNLNRLVRVIFLNFFRKEVKNGRKNKRFIYRFAIYDAANLNRSFAEIKRNFKTLNSDLKLTGNNFKYTEKSTDSYKQRIKELDGTITGYKKNVDDLAKQYDKVSQEQGENSAGAQKLRQEYNKQANELNYFRKRITKNISRI